MSIFANNITPSIPIGTNWNKIGYVEWERYLQEKFPNRVCEYWSAAGLTPDPSVLPSPPSYSKNILKQKFSNKKKLSKTDESELNEVLKRIYEKYGVWVKYKVLMGKNKRIKSIVFYRFC